jgi:aldehyde dehydrogenase (NAD+)
MERVVSFIPNWIEGKESDPGSRFFKFNPATEEGLWEVARSNQMVAGAAVSAATLAQPSWAATTPVRRGEILHAIANAMEAARDEIAEVVHLETGKSKKDALGETGGAIALARFYAGEGQRLFGRTTTSGMANRSAMIFRHPVGVAGLIAAANTPIANIAWKVFPALICGNAAVFKSSEDTPRTSWIVGRIAKECGLPDGVLNIIQGYGRECGAPLVEDERVGVVSFTGSTAVGREIGEACARRLARCSLELGGKNAFVVCDDADMSQAVRWAALSAFSNAGQRCAAASRIIVMSNVYDEFKANFEQAAREQKIGIGDGDDFGPVINQRQLQAMIAGVKQAVDGGATLLAGGDRVGDKGFFMSATVLEGVLPTDEFSCREFFGPICALYKAGDYEEALSLANKGDYGLTACIHTKNLDRAWHFVQNVQAGVASINGATYGSEPHMPFGGLKDSGNGTREPGPEALDIYSNLKNVLLQMDPEAV